MKGIILAGGNATRLRPVTEVVSKQLLPVHDKPMIYYPLSTIMLAGIRDILVITKPQDQFLFKELLGDGYQFGINLNYAVQETPRGLSDAFIVGKNFIGKERCSLILGDNIFYSHGLQKIMKSAVNNIGRATIFGYEVADPQRYGIIEIDRKGNPVSIEEKPKNPKSKYAVPGLYFFDKDVVKFAEKIKPSKRGEIEITDLIEKYLKEGRLDVELVGRGFVWLDTGTFNSLAQAGEFVRVLQERQNSMICCPEEIAYQKGFINKKTLEKQANKYEKSDYGKYLLKLLD